MFYSQRDSKWKDAKLGVCHDTIGQSGCFMTSLANLAWKIPGEVNELFRKEGGYVNGCLVSAERAAALLDLEYKGRSTQKPDHVCIAETNYYASRGVPQHFFVWHPDGRIADPLDTNPDWQQNIKRYPIVSYRLFRFKGQNPAPVSSPETTVEQEDVAVTAETSVEPVHAEPVVMTTQPEKVPVDTQSEVVKSVAASAEPMTMQEGKGLFASILAKLKRFF